MQRVTNRASTILAALERDNLFTVGDEFQSIYGFRHADVGLFRRRRAALGRAGAAAVLSTNFRSRPPLLELVNAVFAGRFGEDFVPLLAGRDIGSEPDREPIVELLVTDTDGWEPHEQMLGVELAPAPLWRRAEARLLARRLDQLIASGEARAEEIVVLFRAEFYGLLETHSAIASRVSFQLARILATRLRQNILATDQHHEVS